MIRFIDDRGVEWEVREVGAAPTPADHRPPRAPRGARVEEGGAWLCFESATQRRRLERYSPRWHAMSPRELTALCREATPASLPRSLAPWSPPRMKVLPDGWA